MLKSILAILFFESAFAQDKYNYFGQLFTGDSTFYGDQGGAGECSFQQFSGSKLPWTTGLTGPKFVALDNPLFYTNTGTAAACGLCIAMSTQNPECTTCGPGPVTSTTEYAIVSDRCPECLMSSLDQGSAGSGRFQVSWIAVQCNTGSTGFVYSTQGSNSFYLKLNVANTRVPVAAVRLEIGGSFAALAGTSDGYWELFSGIQLTFPMRIQVTSVLGDTVIETMPLSSPTDPPTQGSAQFPLHPELNQVGNAPETLGSPECGRFCSSAFVSTEAALPAVVEPTPAATPVNGSISYPKPQASASSCLTAIRPWEQCGGAGGTCGNIQQCVDAQWNSTCCPSGYGCERVNAYWYQCNRNTPDTSAIGCSAAIESSSADNPDVVPIFVADHVQCGGTSNCNQTSTTPSVPVCTDGQWANYTCNTGFHCARYDPHYWTCRELPAVVAQTSNGAIESAGPANESAVVQIESASYCVSVA